MTEVVILAHDIIRICTIKKYNFTMKVFFQRKTILYGFFIFKEVRYE